MPEVSESTRWTRVRGELRERLELAQKRLQTLREYHADVVRIEDWHGATDAAVDIRVVQSEIATLETALQIVRSSADAPS